MFCFSTFPLNPFPGGRSGLGSGSISPVLPDVTGWYVACAAGQPGHTPHGGQQLSRVSPCAGEASARPASPPAGNCVFCSATLHILEGLRVLPQRLFHLSPVSKFTWTVAGPWSISSHLLPGFIVASLCPREAEWLVSSGQAVLVPGGYLGTEIVPETLSSPPVLCKGG